MPGASRAGFEVLGPVGKGSFGLVTKVKHRASGAVMVWKEIAYGELTPEQLGMVVSEVRLLKSFQHAHIVAYYGCIVEPDQKVVVLLMEHCAGGDLDSRIKQLKEKRKTAPESFGVKVATQLCLALQAMGAHDGGNAVIHRDIKPSNILLDEHDNVKLADFGLACVQGGERHHVNKPVGTPFYMAPEMIKAHKTSPSTDMWALGCVLYELAQLKRAFEAKEKEELIQKVMRTQPPKLHKPWSSELCSLVNRMLTHDPAERPHTNSLLGEAPLCEMIRCELADADASSPPQQKWRCNQQAASARVQQCQGAFARSEAAMLEAQRVLDQAMAQYERDASALESAEESLECAQQGVALWEKQASPSRYVGADGQVSVTHPESPIRGARVAEEVDDEDDEPELDDECLAFLSF